MTCSILTTLLPCCCARSFASANTKQINSFRNSCAEQRTGVWALLAELRESRGEEGWRRRFCPPRRRQRGGLGTVMAEVASRAILLLSGSSFFMMRMMFCLGSLHSSSLPSASAPSPSVSSSAGTWGRHKRWLPQRCWRCEASSPLLAAAPFGRGAPLPPPSPPPRHGDAVAHLARHTAR